MNSAKYCIQHKAVMIVLLILITIAGIFSYTKLGRLEDPEFTIKEAVIYTRYPGASAEQVELEVTEPIETAVQQLKQLKEVRSISRAGISIVFAEIEEFYDKETLPQVWDELRHKVNLAGKNLPPGCLKPDVNDDFGDVYGVLFALTGKGYSHHELSEVAIDIKRELLLCQDVGRIDFWGMQPEAVYVDIDRIKLSQLGLDPVVIFNTIQQQNAITESGRSLAGSEDIRLRVGGDYTEIEDMDEQLIDSDSKGRMIRLKDIAKIKRGYFDPPEEILRWNGKPAVGIGISTVSEGDVIAMGDAISKKLELLKSRLPLGIEIHTITHQSETVKKAANDFVMNLIGAVVIVMLLLVLFMGLGEGFIIGIILLVTILATFICMHLMDITFQRISLGALIIALGMLVDNAIVVVEGIVIKSRQGLSRQQAAEDTVRETQWPLLGATVIAILAFAAITLSKDMTGEWLKSLFQVICISLGLSWIFSITITPYLCEAILPDKSLVEKKEPYDKKIFQVYRKFIGLCINNRWFTLSAVIILLISALWGFSFVKQDFMPDMNRPQITVDVWMPEGTHIKKTDKELTAISDYIRTLDGVKNVAGFAGRGPLRFLLTYEPEMPSSAYGQLLVSLDDHKKIPALKTHLNSYLEKHHQSAITSVDAFKLGPGGGAIVARLSGPDDKILMNHAEKIKSVMENNKNTRSIRTDWGKPVKVQTLNFAQARAREAGITRRSVSEALAMNFSGISYGMYRQGDDLLPIILRPPYEQRQGIEKTDDIQIWNKSRHKWIPINQVTNGQNLEWELPVIHRLNRMRVLRISCKQINGTTDGLLRELREEVEAVKLPKGYTLEWGGEHEEQVDANKKLMSNVPIAFTAMFLISVLLFNTLRHPVIIFMGLPLAITGVAAGMLIADKPFGFMAMLGFLSLSGMLIKNEIVLLDQINIEISEGKHPYKAVLDSATSRVRPVCMAAFTTVLGMIPLLWDAFFAPMAVTIMGGLTFATILTLVVIPVLYSTFFKIHN
ncbi:MAG: efflux RND transporter permease subunit [Desulforegulaceae bacterium]|nr:efflux RND transporter permease subunit [Desulforegulaceae bacterium]